MPAAAREARSPGAEVPVRPCSPPPRRLGPVRRWPRAALALACAVAWVAVALEEGARGASPTRVGPPRRLLLRATDLVVLDGDTVALTATGATSGGRVGPPGRLVRLLGADAPESPAPWFDGDQEPWASAAARCLADALQAARTIELVTRQEVDARGRLLGHLLVDGRPAGELLVARGLAVETVSSWGDGGFPEEARAIIRARPRAPLPFEHPAAWRRAHRRE